MGEKVEGILPLTGLFTKGINMYSDKFYDSMNDDFLWASINEPWFCITNAEDEFMMYCMGGEL